MPGSFGFGRRISRALLNRWGCVWLIETNVLESQANRLALEEPEEAVALSRKAALTLRPAQRPGGQQGATLIQWMANGDESAFNLFHHATKGLLFGLLLRILGHTQTAEDVLSELYEDVRKQASRFGKQNEGPLTWLVLIAHRRAIERLCRRLNTKIEISRKIGSKPEAKIVPDSFINITEQRRLIRTALDAIPQMQRRMIELTFFSGMTHLEIAIKLGQSPEAVEQGLRYGMLQLFGLFKSMGFSHGPKTKI
jgi:RNA polymerase sigma-70 factor, ECF subfamily